MNPVISYKSLSQANQEALNEAIMDMGITSYDDLIQAVEVAETFICEATMLLTFKQFQATRVARTMNEAWCDEFYPGVSSAEALVYDTGCFILVKSPGQFHLVIGHNEWYSNHLESLERLLYDRWYC